MTPTNDPYSPKRRLRQIQAYHMFSRGYCDIAYNYLVSRDGRIWRGRGARRIGGHVYNNNTGNVGIAFLGNYMRTRARFRQRCNTAKLLAGLHRRFPRLRLNRRRIKGHRQYGAAGGYTSCPGDRLYRQIRNIVRMSRRGCD